MHKMVGVSILLQVILEHRRVGCTFTFQVRNDVQRHDLVLVWIETSPVMQYLKKGEAVFSP